MATSANLETKLQRPRLDEDLIPRPTLMEQIGRGTRRALTLISAPAGFGKTTLLAARLQDQGGSSSWISLDRNDDESRMSLRN